MSNQNGRNKHEAFHMALLQHDSATEALETRLENWKKIIKMYIDYFEETVEIDNSKLKRLKKLKDKFALDTIVCSNYRLPEEPGIINLNNTLRDFSIQEEKFYETSSHYTTTETIKEFRRLKAELKTNIKIIKEEIGELNADLNKRKAAINLHFDRLEKVEANPKPLEADNDPWLVFYSLEQQLEKAVEEEKNCLRAFQTHIGKLSTYEASLMSSFKAILNNHFSWACKEHNHFSIFKDLIQTKTEEIKDDIEWTSFVERLPELNVITNTSEQISLEDVTKPYTNKTIFQSAKKCDISKKSTMSMFKKEKDHPGILTNTGFIHGFHHNYSENRAPFFSIHLANCTVQPDVNHNHVLMLTEKNDGMMKSDKVYFLKCRDENDLNDWIKILTPQVQSILTKATTDSSPSQTPAEVAN